MSVNAFNNLNNNGGDTTVILNSGTSLANGTDRIVPMSALGLYGGTLSTASKAFKVNTALRGAGEIANLAFGDGASASLTNDLTVTATMTLDGSMTFLKDQEATDDVVVTPAALTAASGTITVGAGVTFNVGTSRPAATLDINDEAALVVKLATDSDIATLSVASQPANLEVYDAKNEKISDPDISYDNGTLTIRPPVPTLNASGVTDFSDSANWKNGMPTEGGSVIVNISGDADIKIDSACSFDVVTISGQGGVAFTKKTGAVTASFTANTIRLMDGAKLMHASDLDLTATSIVLDSGTVLKLSGPVTETAAISGAGAVETYGTVVLAHANTMTGGITVKPGSALSTTVAGGYGEYQAGWAYTAQRQVVVEDGGTVDINNVANRDGAVALTIAGQGILSGDVYSGAVTYSGAAAITSGSRQISSLVLTGDAMVDVGAGWGLVHSGWNNARLGLEGHTLTVRGTGTFPVVNVNNLSGAATTGTLVLDGATLELSNAASNLAGVNVVAKGCATVNIAQAPSALGSLTLKPTATGTTATNWNLPSGFVPSLDTSNVDSSELSVGNELTLFTAPSETELTGDTITVKASGRYTTTISGNTVTATVKAPANFMHYDFNAENSIASDSTYNFGNLNPTFVNGKNGKAGKFVTGTTPWYDTNTAGKSPFHAGEMTVTALLKAREANNTILWNIGSTVYDSKTGIALIARDSSTLTLVAWVNGGAGADVVSVTGVDVLNKWHLVAVVSDANGTSLYVDDQSESVSTCLPSDINVRGQFGSIHGNRKSYSVVGADGFLLDDWRVYDAALTATEIGEIRNAMLPTPFIFFLK